MKLYLREIGERSKWDSLEIRTTLHAGNAVDE